MTNHLNHNPSSSIRVAIVEDHNVVREGLVLMLKKEPKITVSFDAANGLEFFKELPYHTIDVVILDLDMPVMDGKETLHKIRKDFPQLKVIILSMHEDPWIIKELINERINSYLGKNCRTEEMIDAIFNVKFKGHHSSALIEQAMFNTRYTGKVNRNSSNALLELSSRHSLILKMICDGKTSDQIADRMCLAKKTIDGIRAELLKRIGAKNSTELVRKSILLGLYKVRTDEQICAEDEIVELEKHNRI